VEAKPEAAALPDPEPLVPRKAIVDPVQPAFGGMPQPVQASAKSEDTNTGPIDFEVPLAQDASTPRRVTTGVLRVETLAATFEEVEFLASLGLDADAMDVLKAYLHDSASPAPLAFFELMRLCNEGEDATAIGTVRRRYVQAFGVEAPRLEQLTAPIGLEQIPHLSGTITRAWGTSRALELIEEALFRVPEPGAALTLQAGRDLICLYDVAMAIATEGGAQAGSDAEAHPLAPWANAEDAIGARAAAQAAAEAQGGHHFALDVDLGAAHEELPETAEPVDLAPLLADIQSSAREKARVQQEEEDAFSAAVASERTPVSRY
jgi:pilus assembly protein FimV